MSIINIKNNLNITHTIFLSSPITMSTRKT